MANTEVFNEYDTTVDMIEKYILRNTIQVTMAETRFYKNLANSKKKADEEIFENKRESMVLKSARFRIYNSDSGVIFSQAEKVRKAEDIKAELERIKENSATTHELNHRFKKWKENNADYNDIMTAIGASQIESLRKLGLSLDKLTSQKEGFEHVKAILENAVQEGKITPKQAMSYKLGTWRYLSAPDLHGLVNQKQNKAKLSQSALPSAKTQQETAVTPEKSIPQKTPEALLAAKVTLDEIIKRCGYPAGTKVQTEKILPLLKLAEAKGFITREERPAFEKALLPLIG